MSMAPGNAEENAEISQLQEVINELKTANEAIVQEKKDD